jgi:hypothetical protein
MGSCPFGPETDIGDYENQLDMWNRLNLLDYDLTLGFFNTISSKGKAAVIIVRNGVPESSDPPEWLASGEMSTVPEIYSFIKKEAERIKNAFTSERLYACYDTYHHYPNKIYKHSNGGTGEHDWEWNIKLVARRFGTDIGDYENQLNVWNSQNMLDYKLMLNYRDLVNDDSKEVVINVENGVPESSDPPEWLADGEMSTVPEIYSFIKEEVERIKNANSLESLFVHNYDIDYHYPRLIHMTGLSGFVWTWDIELTPPVENAEEVWNKRNLFDYELSLIYTDIIGGLKKEALITVRNGIPESSDPPEWLESGEKSTILDFFSFIKGEEKRLEYVKASEDGFLLVRYLPTYQSPFYIVSKRNYSWVIGLSENR